MIVSKPEQFKDLPPGTYTVTGDAAAMLAEQQAAHILREHQRNRRIQKVKRK